MIRPRLRMVQMSGLGGVTNSQEVDSEKCGGQMRSSPRISLAFGEQRPCKRFLCGRGNATLTFDMDFHNINPIEVSFGRMAPLLI